MAEKAGNVGAVYAAYGAGTAGTNEAVVLVAGVGKIAHAKITGIDIAFVDGGAGADTITGVAAGFVAAGFVAGDRITVSGSASNNGNYTIVTVVAATITLATGVLTAEIAGATVTITATGNVLVSKVTSDAGGTTPITKAWYCTVQGSLVVTDGGTDTVYVTYAWWAEGTYGVAGKIGIVAGFFSWSLNLVGDVLETTDYSDAGLRTYISGLKGWTGSAEKHWITELPLEWIGTKLIIKLYVDNIATPKLRYEGFGVITGHGVTSSVDTLVSESISFQGDSVLTYEST